MLTPMTGQTPVPTLFPTRRSSDLKRGARAALVKLGSEGCAFSAADGARVHVRPWRPPLLPEPGARAPARQDRKSTRLNSSHPSISYAVFCLKKKYIDS